MSLYSRLRAVSLEVRYQISCREALWPLMKPYSMTRTRRFMRSEEARPEEARVHRGLSIVVDGFPGSANSFAMRAFRAMQGESPTCLVKPVRAVTTLSDWTGATEIVAPISVGME